MKKSFLPLLVVLGLLLFGGVIYVISTYRMPMIGGMMATNNGTGHMTSPTTNGASFSQSTQGLPEAREGQEVRLNNGDTYALTAAPVKKTINGKELRLLAYNGMLPGPRIRVRQGDEISVRFTNNTDVETTIHSHGVRVENAFDGVVDVTQKAVQPGESFTYKLRFPDTGVFWYHPHVRDDYQQESGLYANFYVEPKEGAFASPVNGEAFLFLDDIKLSATTLEPFNAAFTNFSLMGRFGNTFMINWDSNYTLMAKQGEVRRLFLTNSANTRTFNFSIPGAKMKLVGSDGGKYERETFVDSVIISPSERYIVDVYFPKAGDLQIMHTFPGKSIVMGQIKVTDALAEKDYAKEFNILQQNGDVIATLSPLRKFLTTAPDKELLFSIDMGMGSMNHGMAMGAPEKIEWEETMGGMNQMSTSNNTTWKIIDQKTGKANMDIDWTFQQGDMVKIRIKNDETSAHPMQHPFHMHGQRFAVLATNGVANANLVWKDSVLVQTGDTMDILVEMSNPGSWMAHCHILEHLHSGMMFGFVVEKAGDSISVQ